MARRWRALGSTAHHGCATTRRSAWSPIRRSSRMGGGGFRWRHVGRIMGKRLIPLRGSARRGEEAGSRALRSACRTGRTGESTGHSSRGGAAATRAGKRRTAMALSATRPCCVRPRPLFGCAPPLLSRGRALTDDFHQHQHSAAEHRTRSVCLGIPLATCTLPVGVCYLLTY